MTNNRKPAHLEYVGGKSPRQQIWEQIRTMKRFAVSDLIRWLPGTIHKDTTRTYVKNLIAAGFLEHVSSNVEYVEFALVKDNGVEAPRVRKDGTVIVNGTGQENMWRTLRSIGHPVGFFELAAFASTDQVQVAPIAARDYLGNLFKAGYLVKTGDKYHLLPGQNTGPRPPMIQRIKQVYDPNLGRIVWSENKENDDE